MGAASTSKGTKGTDKHWRTKKTSLQGKRKDETQTNKGRGRRKGEGEGEREGWSDG